MSVFTGFFQTEHADRQAMPPVICNYFDTVLLRQNGVHRFPPVDDCRLYALFTRMHMEYETREMGYENVLCALLTEVLVYIIRQERETTAKKSVKTQQRRNVRCVLSYMEQHFTEKLTLETLSRIALTSPAYLCRLFKEATGETISVYIQKMRVEAMRRRLLETDDSFMHIAWDMGYETEAFARKIFVKHVGMTLGQYRQRGKVTQRHG